jgi:hypothetical protein
MWHLQNNNAADGPFDAQQVSDLVRTGALTRKTLVWTEGMEDWSAAEDTALLEHFRSIPPPIRKLAAAPPHLIATPPAFPVSPQTLPAGFKNPQPLANWLTALLVTSLLFGVVAIWSSSEQLDLLERIRSNGQFTMAEANASDARQQIIGIIQFVIFFTTTILFGRWIYIAARNVRSLGAQNLQFTPGWAIGYYFIPFANLYTPYRAMKEIWKASRAPLAWQREKSSYILGFWWTFWIISCIAGQMSMRATLAPRTPNDYSDAATLAMFSDVVDIPLCKYAILLVRKLSTRQLTTATNVAQQ